MSCINQGAVNFALMMSQMEGGCPVDYNTITDLFLQVSFVFIYNVLLTSNIPSGFSCIYYGICLHALANILLFTEEYDTGGNSFFIGCSEAELAGARFSSNQG